METGAISTIHSSLQWTQKSLRFAARASTFLYLELDQRMQRVVNQQLKYIEHAQVRGCPIRRIMLITMFLRVR